MNSPLTNVYARGQPYVDRPVVYFRRPLALAVGTALGRPMRAHVVVGYERHELRWVKPA